MIYFDKKEYRLLRDRIPRPEEGDYPETIWLYRAAAYRDGAALTEAEREELLKYYERSDSALYHRLGRMLLRLDDPRDIARSALMPKELCEAAFFLGWRAKTDGDYDEAADWFRVSIGTDLVKQGEYQWSFNQLYVWRNIGESLSHQARRAAKTRERRLLNGKIG